MSMPQAVTESASVLLQQATDYLATQGVTITPASTEQLTLNAALYALLLANIQTNYALNQNFLAYAQNVSLDNLGSLVNCNRLDGESDEAYRARIPLSLKALSAGGTADYYKYHALASSGTIIDATAVMTVAGTVQVTILSATDTTAADDLLLATVTLTSDSVRSLCDTILVQNASAVTYSVTANITPQVGVLFGDAQAACVAAINALNASWRKLGQDIIPSQIIDACHKTGTVSRVELTSPAFLAVGQSAYPSASTITVGAL
jgi:phage-related baseplate assembly protein